MNNFRTHFAEIRLYENLLVFVLWYIFLPCHAYAVKSSL